MSLSPAAKGAWRLKRTAQCAKCLWRVEVDPNTIPNGYTEERHRNLASTIANPAQSAMEALAATELHIMACHETHDAHCIGWLAHQLGPGNNIALRLSMLRCENGRGIRLRGEQHATFEDTLPKEGTHG